MADSDEQSKLSRFGWMALPSGAVAVSDGEQIVALAESVPDALEVIRAFDNLEHVLGGPLTWGTIKLTHDTPEEGA